MGIIAIACYRPKKGKSKEVLKLITEHYPILLKNDLVTKRNHVVMKSKDRTLIEIFEWKSKKAKELAHSNENIMAIWNRFESISDNIPLSELEEAEGTFANFTPI